VGLTEAEAKPAIFLERLFEQGMTPSDRRL